MTAGPARLRVHRSAPAPARDRGRAFGAAEAPRIAAALANYRALWDARHGAAFDCRPAGEAALEASRAFAPHLADEMEGIAEGAGLDPRLIGALNARTEILALAAARGTAQDGDRESDWGSDWGRNWGRDWGPSRGGGRKSDWGRDRESDRESDWGPGRGGGRGSDRGECSAVIALRPGAAPVAVQTWDWYHRFRDGWLVWEIALEDGTVTKTMTEYGIVGKSGLNTRGVGLLFTILHHRADGGPVGVPVHVAARAALDLGTTLYTAAEVAAGARVSASSSLNLLGWDGRRGQAITVELSPEGPGYALPEANGTLIHTNHFLDPRLAAGDTEPAIHPDTLLRRDMLRRELAAGVSAAAGALAALDSHLGGDAALCCHPAPGRDPADAYATLATVAIDLGRGELRVHPGGPCTHPGL